MRLNLIALLIAFLSIHGVHQKPTVPQEDSIEDKNIAVINSAKARFNAGTRPQLEKAFGKTKVVKEADEVLGGFAYTYKYKGGLEVYYNEKNCEAMDVKGPGFKVLLNGVVYSVGEPITKLQKPFPISYKNRREGSINLWIKGADAYVAVVYNKKGLITRIVIANDNS